MRSAGRGRSCVVFGSFRGRGGGICTLLYQSSVSFQLIQMVYIKLSVPMSFHAKLIPVTGSEESGNRA